MLPNEKQLLNVSFTRGERFFVKFAFVCLYVILGNDVKFRDRVENALKIETSVMRKPFIIVHVLVDNREVYNSQPTYQTHKCINKIFFLKLHQILSFSSFISFLKLNTTRFNAYFKGKEKFCHLTESKLTTIT